VPSISFVLALVVSGQLAPGASTALAATDRAVELADEAVQRSPDLAAASTTIDALEQRVRGAGAWMDPQLSVTYANMPIDTWLPGSTPMSGIQVQLRQPFLWPGKVAAREAEAQAQVREQAATVDEKTLQLRSMVKRAYYQLALVRQLRAVTAEHVALVQQYADVVRVRLEAGRAGQHDLLRLQLLHDKLTDDLNAFQRDDDTLTAAINAALHRGTETKIETPVLLVPPPPPEGVAPLLASALDRRPLLKRYAEQAEVRRAMARRAARETWPDVSAIVGYTVRTPAGADPGTDFVSLGVALPLPVFSVRRQRSLEAEFELQAKSVEQQRDAEIDTIRSGLSRAVAAWKRAAQEAKTYRAELIPMAHRTVDATLAAYTVDKADFASLFQAELQLLDYERTVRQAEAQANVARVDTQALVGEE